MKSGETVPKSRCVSVRRSSRCRVGGRGASAQTCPARGDGSRVWLVSPRARGGGGVSSETPWALGPVSLVGILALFPAPGRVRTGALAEHRVHRLLGVSSRGGGEPAPHSPGTSGTLHGPREPCPSCAKRQTPRNAARPSRGARETRLGRPATPARAGTNPGSFHVY